MRGPALVALFAFAAAGCATKADVETLESSIVEEMGQIRDDQRVLLAQMRAAVDSLDAAEARRASTGQGELDRRVQRLEGAIAELLEIVQQNNQLLNDLLQRSGAGASRGGQPSGSDSGFGARGGDVDAELYNMALGQFRSGNYETARGAFEDFLTAQPGHELAPDAQFWLARSYEEAGDVSRAQAEFRRLTELYPGAPRSASALYALGLIEAKAGNRPEARRLFAQVQTGYPDSPEATLAREEIRKLGG
jgi:tol-pal system protein YbgF